VLGFPGDVEDFRGFAHQAVGGFEGGHASLEVELAGVPLQVGVVQVLEHDAFELLPRHGLDGAFDIGEGCGAGEEARALVIAGEEA